MDWKKKNFIDRFVQSVVSHGPSLIPLTRDEHGDGEESTLNFLNPRREGNMGMNYFRNKLQVSCPAGETNEYLGALSEMHQSRNEDREILHPFYRQQPIQSGVQDDDFNQSIKRFVATKADLLFSMEGKQKLQRGVDFGLHSNQEVLDPYADTPPLETLMEIPLHVRRTQLFKCLKEGDIVIGKVTYKRPFGIIVTLTMLESGCNRDFSDLDIQALCKLSELDSPELTKEYKDPTDAYVIGDIIRGVITNVNGEEGKMSISLRNSRLPDVHKHVCLGVVDDSDAVFTRLQDNPDGLNYEEHLNKHKGFNNPRNIDTLTDLLGIDTTAPCSLLRCFQSKDCPEGDYAEPLRRRQSAKWSMETTAKGVEHFKTGNHEAAMKYFEHALQIDGQNVEALVARGALYANDDKLAPAIKDFRAALAICSSHRNANKYLTATLVEQGIQREKEGMLSDAIQSFKEALEIDNNQQTARDHLEKIQLQIKVKEQKKEQAAARVDKGLKSRFSHVRELILEEQFQSKKKRKKDDRKKKKKKVKVLKKKKKKSKAKVRRGSKRTSSISSSSSNDSSSESESSRTDSSESSEEWVEKSGAESSKRKTSRDYREIEKPNQRDEIVNFRGELVHPDTLHSDKPDKRMGEDTLLHSSRSRTYSSPEYDRYKRHSTWKGNSDKTTKCRPSSSSKSHSSFEKEREKQPVEDRGNESRRYRSRDARYSPQKRAVSEEHAENVKELKRTKSPRKEGKQALSPLDQTFLEGELKRIRAHSEKDNEKRQSSTRYRK